MINKSIEEKYVLLSRLDVIEYRKLYLEFQTNYSLLKALTLFIHQHL